jgi:hypothetical protein
MNHFSAMRRFLLPLGCFAASAAMAQTASEPAVVAPAPVAAASSGTPAIDEVIPELDVGQDVYYDVHVTDVTPLTIVFTHRHGIASVLLTDLSPDLQKRFGYDPAKAAAETARRQAAISTKKPDASAAPAGKSPPKIDAQQILQSFGKPPKIFAEVNMEPHFDQLGVDTTDKGPRPSSAIFSILSAMEFESAPPDGPAPEYSEEYLIWATLKSLGKIGLAVPKNQSPTLDLGFQLKDVAEAMRIYGIALAAEVPYRFNMADAHVFEPPADIIEKAKQRIPADGYFITDQEPKAQISNIVQVLNAGVPVIIQINWPAQKTFTDNVKLDEQTGLEATQRTVLLLSYQASTDKLEDTEFLFKNAYGNGWGGHGYGIATYRYLLNNLHDALFLVPR